MSLFHLLIPLLAAGPARADEALRARVVDLLSGLESSPSAADWSALGLGAEAELLTLAADSTMLPTQRGNALLALGKFPTDRAHTLLVAMLVDDSASAMLRRKACSGLAQGWGAGAVPALSVALADDDVQLRQSAAAALAKVSDPTAQAALRARLAVESNTSVLRVIEQAVRP